MNTRHQLRVPRFRELGWAVALRLVPLSKQEARQTKMRCGKGSTMARLFDLLVDYAYAMRLCSAYLAVSLAVPRKSPVVVTAAVYCCLDQFM